MGGGGSQRELLLRLAGSNPSAVLTRRVSGEIRFFPGENRVFSGESAREEQRTRAQQFAAQCGRRCRSRLVAYNQLTPASTVS
jgi:hypothetical protein